MEISLQRYVKKLLMARCQPLRPQRKKAGMRERAACRTGCLEKRHKKSAGDRAFFAPFLSIKNGLALITQVFAVINSYKALNDVYFTVLNPVGISDKSVFLFVNQTNHQMRRLELYMFYIS